MKKNLIFLTCMLFTVALFAQKDKKVLEVKNYIWGADDPYKNVVDVPAKWAKESAVIIYQEFNYDYAGSAQSVHYSESTRRRIKLQDKSAVDAYSEFSFAERFNVTKGFSSRGGRVFAGVKVIKSNGKETEIDLEDAVELKSDSRETLKKIAIPDLEVGDIIDYYYYIFEPFTVTGEYVFDPIISRLNDSYPVMKQKLEFEVGKDFFINFTSLNGAPDLKVKDASAKKEVVYNLYDEDREKEDPLRWYYPRRVEPIVKFQVVYARKSHLEKTARAFLGEKETVKKKVSKEEVLSYFQNRYAFSEGGKGVNRYLKDKGIAASDREAMVREAYYYYRYEELVSKIEPIMFLQEGYVSLLPMSYGNFWDDDDFVRAFGNFLLSRDIDFDVLAAIPRSVSDLDDLLLRDELSMLLRVNLEKPIYLSRFGLHTNFNEIPEELEGAMAYEMKLDDKDELAKIKMVQLPVYPHERNQSKTISEVIFTSDDLNEMEIKRTISHIGHNKDRFQTDLIYPYDYLDEDYQYFDILPYLKRLEMKKKLEENIAAKLAAKIKTDKEVQKEAFEESARSDMDLPIKEYDTYELQQLGRYGEEKGLTYAETFALEGLVKRAGKNYILEAGKLIGGQVALAEDEIERSRDIYMPFARSFVYDVSIKMPEGFTVEGIENLQKKVENSAGGFVSSAEVKDGYLKINTLKYYSNNFEKAENWPQMVAFLEASFKFTQEKVLLKPE